VTLEQAYKIVASSMAASNELKAVKHAHKKKLPGFLGSPSQEVVEEAERRMRGGLK